MKNMPDEDVKKIVTVEEFYHADGLSLQRFLVWVWNRCQGIEFSKLPDDLQEFEEADYVIRFYFARPKAFANALKFFHTLPKSEGIHDDLILSLSNQCGIVPVVETVGWEELDERGVGYSKRATHYQERDELCSKSV